MQGLSQREREVLHLMTQGKVNLDIAKDLTISTSTVKNHVNRIYRKLGVANRVQAVLKVVNPCGEGLLNG